MEKNKYIIICLAIIQTIASCILFTNIFEYNFSYNIISVLLLFFYYKIDKKIVKKLENKRKTIILYIIGSLFSISIFIGMTLSYGNGFTNIFYILSVILVAVLNSPIFVWIFNKIFIFIEKNEKEEINYTTSKKDILLIFIVILLIWIPVLLAYYPGIFDYDVHTQLNYVINNDYSTHHPLIHTLILGFFYNIGEKLGSYNIGMLFYTIMQMLFVAIIMTYAIVYLKNRGISKRMSYIVILFYAILPLNSVLTISITKDIYFSAFVLAFIVSLMQIRDQNWKLSKKYILFILYAIFMILFRSNAIYALIISLIIMMFLGIKKHKNIILAVLISIVLAMLIQNGMEGLLNAYTKNEKDMLSIPLQQLARVGNECKNELTEEEYSEITYYVSPNYYNKYLSDPIKNHTDISKIRNDYKKFFSIWLKYFIKYPTVYLESFLYNTQGYWDVNDISHSKIYGINKENRTGYLLTGTKNGYGVEHISYCKPIESLYEYLFTENKYQSIPVISLLFAPATYIWIYILCLAYNIYKKKTESIIILTFFIGLLITLLVGPTCLIRYVYPFVICLPIIVSDIFICKNRKKE